MNKTEIFLIMLASILALVFIAIRVTWAKKSEVGAVVGMMSKAVASVGFIAVGVFALSGVTNVYGASFIIMGLVMGLIGDIVLDEKVIHIKTPLEGVYLTGGMVSFAIGHIFYLIGMLKILGTSILTGGAFGIAIAGGITISAVMMLVGKNVLKFNFGDFFIHSTLYGFLLGFMTVLMIVAYVISKDVGLLRMMIGMILFLASDVVLSQMYFGGKPKDNILIIANHALYYGAQIAIASYLFVI